MVLPQSNFGVTFMLNHSTVKKKSFLSSPVHSVTFYKKNALLTSLLPCFSDYQVGIYTSDFSQHKQNLPEFQECIFGIFLYPCMFLSSVCLSGYSIMHLFQTESFMCGHWYSFPLHEWFYTEDIGAKQYYRWHVCPILLLNAVLAFSGIHLF